MPGAPILHGYNVSASPAGEGGATRLAAAGAGFTNAGFPDQLTFFLWLVIIGVVIPGFILGALRLGGIHFVFKGRR
jgi:hypothetical protein